MLWTVVPFRNILGKFLIIPAKKRFPQKFLYCNRGVLCIKLVTMVARIVIENCITEIESMKKRRDQDTKTRHY